MANPLESAIGALAVSYTDKDSLLSARGIDSSADAPSLDWLVAEEIAVSKYLFNIRIMRNAKLPIHTLPNEVLLEMSAGCMNSLEDKSNVFKVILVLGCLNA